MINDFDFNVQKSPTLHMIGEYLTEKSKAAMEAGEGVEFPFDLQGLCNALDDIQFDMFWLIRNAMPRAHEMKPEDVKRWLDKQEELGLRPEPKPRIIR